MTSSRRTTSTALLPHFYRHLDRVLDLTFVRDLVYSCYVADTGRPSVDPVVFFRLQLVMFFEGIRSEPQLVRLTADRLSVRWYLGYNLDEPLPDHSSLTRIRTRYGVETFRRFFDAILERCQQAGLVWGKELYFDWTEVQARDDGQPVAFTWRGVMHRVRVIGAGVSRPAGGSLPTPLTATISASSPRTSKSSSCTMRQRPLPVFLRISAGCSMSARTDDLNGSSYRRRHTDGPIARSSLRCRH